jgi:hypothetical protein
MARTHSIRATIAGVADNNHGDRARLTRSSLGEGTGGVSRTFHVAR